MKHSPYIAPSSKVIRFHMENPIALSGKTSQEAQANEFSFESKERESWEDEIWDDSEG